MSRSMNFKKIVLEKWNTYPELEAFVKYVVPQWFEGMFSNWQIFKTPPGFANTNNPMEAFNKIINYERTSAAYIYSHCSRVYNTVLQQ